MDLYIGEREMKWGQQEERTIKGNYYTWQMVEPLTQNMKI
jgi:hypothetical protein